MTCVSWNASTTPRHFSFVTTPFTKVMFMSPIRIVSLLSPRVLSNVNSISEHQLSIRYRYPVVDIRFRAKYRWSSEILFQPRNPRADLSLDRIVDCMAHCRRGRHSPTFTCGHVSSLEVVAVDSHITVTVTCIRHVSVMPNTSASRLEFPIISCNLSVFRYTLRAFH